MEPVNEQQLQKLLEVIAELGIEGPQFDNLMKSEKFLELLKYHAVSCVFSVWGHAEYNHDLASMLASARRIAPPSDKIRDLHFISDISRPDGSLDFKIFHYNRPISNKDVLYDLTYRRYVRPGILADLLALSSYLTEERFLQKGNIIAPASYASNSNYVMYPFLKYNHDTKQWELRVESFLKPSHLGKEPLNPIWSKDFYFLASDTIGK